MVLENYISSGSVRVMRILFSFLFVAFVVNTTVRYINNVVIEGYAPAASSHHTRTRANIFDTEYLEKRAAKDDIKHQFESNKTLLPGSPVWKETGTFRYGGTGYVPDYEESIYLNDQFHSTPEHLTNMPYLNGGFCSALASTPMQMEDKCNSLDGEVCASTECCVLLGGQKCVKGNESGPYFKNNYSDFLIKNKDYFYYQGKCVGNCPASS